MNTDVHLTFTLVQTMELTMAISIAISNYESFARERTEGDPEKVAYFVQQIEVWQELREEIHRQRFEGLI